MGQTSTDLLLESSNYVANKSDMSYPNLESLRFVEEIITEIQRANSGARPTGAREALRAALDKVIYFAATSVAIVLALFLLGSGGLSAAGITSALAIIGLGGGMLFGLLILIAVVFFAYPLYQVGFAAFRNKLKLREEKQRLYKAALECRPKVIGASELAATESKDKHQYLQGLRLLLEVSIKNLQHDLGITKQASK